MLDLNMNLTHESFSMIRYCDDSILLLDHNGNTPMLGQHIEI